MSTPFEPRVPVLGSVIPLNEPDIAGNEWAYVKECLDAGWVSSAGPFVDRFEREFGAYVGARHAVATVNGTAALHVALLVAGIEPDHEVLVSSLTFIAPVNAIRYVGAWPVFIDAEPEYWQMDPDRVRNFLNAKCRRSNGELRNRATGRRVRGIVPVHILGHPVDMDPILEIAREYDLRVIEDATESLGATYRGRMVGCLADIACFSFNGNKIITTGGGGMIVTNQESWADRAHYLTTQAKDDPLEYIHGTVGYNYRLTNVQAAIGCAQLERLPRYIQTKRRIAANYARAFEGTSGLITMRQASWASSTWWLYTIRLDSTCAGGDSRELMRTLRAVGIESRPLWQPANRSPAYATIAPPPCPVAELLNREAVSLPSSVGLTEADQELVTRTVLQGRGR